MLSSLSYRHYTLAGLMHMPHKTGNTFEGKSLNLIGGLLQVFWEPCVLFPGRQLK